MQRLEIYCPGFKGIGFNAAGFYTKDLSSKERGVVLTRMEACGRSFGWRLDDGDWDGLVPPVSSKPLVVTNKEGYATGATRGTAVGRGRYDLISSRFLRRLAIHLEKGAEHYAPRNWEKGLPLCRSFGSMIRHAYQWLSGARDEDHLAAVACNIMFLIHTEELIQEGLLPSSLMDELPNG